MTLKLKLPPLIARPPTFNMLLAALSPSDLLLISADLESVRLPLRTVLYEPGEPIDYIYFPTTGCVSMIHETVDGSVEVGTIGLDAGVRDRIDKAVEYAGKYFFSDPGIPVLGPAGDHDIITLF